MAVSDNDLVLVQRGSVPFRATAQEVSTYVKTDISNNITDAVPIATAATLGVIRVGTGLQIDAATGVLSSPATVGGLVYKGQADFTGAAPVTATSGDVYINTVVGTGAWNGFVGQPVVINERAVYNGTVWDLLPADVVGIAQVTATAPVVATVGGAGNDVVDISLNAATQISAGSLSASDKIKLDGLDPGANGIVKQITATLPVSVSGTATDPIISTRQASTTQSGHVARTATVTDVAPDAVSPSSTAVVTANLLSATNLRINDLDAGNVKSIQAGTNITVTALDAQNPVVSVTPQSFIPFDISTLGELP